MYISQLILYISQIILVLQLQNFLAFLLKFVLFLCRGCTFNESFPWCVLMSSTLWSVPFSRCHELTVGCYWEMHSAALVLDAWECVRTSQHNEPERGWGVLQRMSNTGLSLSRWVMSIEPQPPVWLVPHHSSWQVSSETWRPTVEGAAPAVACFPGKSKQFPDR